MFPDVFFISGSPYSSWALSKACAAKASRAIVLAQAAAAAAGEAAGAAEGVDPDAETIFVLQVHNVLVSPYGCAVLDVCGVRVVCVCVCRCSWGWTSEETL
jgi:hypothetical protein